MAKDLYMSSDHVEWWPFIKEQRWEKDKRLQSEIEKPFKGWSFDKRRLLAQQRAEEISDAVFHHRADWHKDVLKTLKEYPEVNDAILGLIKIKTNEYIAMARQPGRLNGVKPSDLAALAMAQKIVTESKHKSLLINEWSFKTAETYSDPKQFGTEEEKVKDQTVTMELKGGGQLTMDEVKQLFLDYLDKPEIKTIDAVKVPK